MRHLFTNANGTRMGEDQLKDAMGLSGSRHWPAQGVPVRTIQGFQVYVRSIVDTKLGVKNDGFPLLNSRSKKTDQWSRAIVICPQCSKHMSFGRFEQHFHAMHKAPEKASAAE
jgi:hypothetical protein